MNTRTRTITRIQSAWTKGMQSKVLSARNDTNLLDKGAALLDNVIIMQQGGLRKRPCNKLSCALPYPNLLGVVFLIDALWAITTDQVNTVAFSRIDSTDAAITVNIASGSPTNGNIKFVQDQATILFAPQWVNVTASKTGSVYSFTPSPFIFNSFSVTQRLPNKSYFSTYDDTIPIYIFYRGEGDLGSRNQAGTPGGYLAVGNTVGIWAPAGLVFSANIPLGTIIQVNGLIIKITFAPVNGGAPNTYMEGIIMIGSVAALATVKHDVYMRFDTGAINILADIYSVTTRADQPVFQTNSFNNSMLPQLITNFQNRLIAANVEEFNPANLNGIDKNHTTIWCSAAGNKFSYLQLTAEDDSPFSVTLSGTPTPQLLNIFADNFLYTFADTGVYAFVNTLNTTFTSTNISLRKIGTHRCNPTPPVSHWGSVFYVQDNAKTVLSLSPTSDIIEMDRTILCPSFMHGLSHLCSVDYLNSVDDVTDDHSSYLFALGDNVDQDTGDIGSKCILSYQFLASQDIDGWTRWTFDGTKHPTALFSCVNRLFVAFDDNNLYEFVLGKYVDDSADVVDEEKVPPHIKIRSNNFALRDQVTNDLLFLRKKYGHIYVQYLNTFTYTINGEIRNVGSLFNGEEPMARSGIDPLFQADSFEIIKYITIEQQHPSDLQILATSVGLTVE